MSESPTRMSADEKRVATALAGIFSFRMLGLFMILPVFALYAQDLDGVTPALMGLAIGIYGLTQAVLQIPYGMASDRFGRKRVIALGLLVFAAGSVIAASADSVTGVIVGRAVQGAGAVAAAVMALLADLTREEHRTKAMAFIGMSIGLSFLVAMVAGPLLNQWIGVPGIFGLTAVLALLGIALLYGLVPDPATERRHRDLAPALTQVRRVLTDAELVRTDIGIFVLHMVLTAGFVALPLALRDAGLAPGDHWLVYLPVMVVAMAVAIPFIIVAERRRAMKQVLVGAVAVLALAEFGLAQFHTGLTILVLLVGIFFIGFNLLEASLPSLVSKLAPVESKGTAMGVYSSAQFLGAFVGGWVGGRVFGDYGFEGLFLACAAALLLWLGLVATMRRPRHLSTRILHLDEMDLCGADRLRLELAAVPGVAEVAVNVEDRTAYLKVDNEALDAAALGRFSRSA